VTTSLQGNVSRWYDSAVGRWLSEDSIGFAGKDTNLSRYVGNLPTQYVDPFGYAKVRQYVFMSRDELIAQGVHEHITYEMDRSGAKYGFSNYDEILADFGLKRCDVTISRTSVDYQGRTYEYFDIFNNRTRTSVGHAFVEHANIFKDPKNPREDEIVGTIVTGVTLYQDFRDFQWQRLTGPDAVKEAGTIAVAGIGGRILGLGGLPTPKPYRLTPGRLSRMGRTYVAPRAFMNCFPADTLVATEHGLRPIQGIRKGDQVWSYDIPSSEWKLCRVLDTFTNEHEGELVKVHVANEAIESTAHHPWWVVSGEALSRRPRPDHVPPNPEAYNGEGRWVDAIDLKVGDRLLLRSGENPTISSIEFRHSWTTVYNFRVESLQCYSVGQSQVLVHNNSYLLNNKSIAGKSPCRIRADRPRGWRELPAGAGHGWRMVDENGVERIRYMYPNPEGRFYHQQTGYFRRINPDGQYLDMHGNVVPETDPLFHVKTHIIPEN
jgi:hypothetical protein